MDVEDFKKKYEQLKDNPMYKNFCSILDTKSQVLERTAKENQELNKKLDELQTLLSQQKEFIEWLEDYINALKQQKETVEGLDIGEEHILMTLEEVLERYKEIIAIKNE